MSDKRTTEEEVVASLRDGMTIAIGGWGSRRKPMSIVRAIVRSDLKDLTLVSYGGPDVGMLCAAGKVRSVVYAFVSLDSIPLEPHFRAARQNGTIANEPLDEGLFLLGLQAAAWRVPFLPSRVGLGSDLFRDNPTLKTITYEGEELVAMPALHLDAALIHQNRGDERGNGQFLGPDLYFDDLFVAAAERAYVSCEEVVPTEELGTVHPATMRIQRAFVSGVVPAPGGAHFTSCEPDYDRDEAFQRAYVEAASDPERWAEFSARFLAVDEAGYQAAVAELRATGATR